MNKHHLQLFLSFLEELKWDLESEMEDNFEDDHRYFELDLEDKEGIAEFLEIAKQEGVTDHPFYTLMQIKFMSL